MGGVGRGSRYMPGRKHSLLCRRMPGWLVVLVLAQWSTCTHSYARGNGCFDCRATHMQHFFFQLYPCLTLGSPMVLLECTESHLLAMTSNGNVYVWYVSVALDQAFVCHGTPISFTATSRDLLQMHCTALENVAALVPSKEVTIRTLPWCRCEECWQ